MIVVSAHVMPQHMAGLASAFLAGVSASETLEAVTRGIGDYPLVEPAPEQADKVFGAAMFKKYGREELLSPSTPRKTTNQNVPDEEDR